MKTLYGDLHRRILLNRKRMSSDLYRPNTVFVSGGDWPGDFEGRAILSLCSLYHALDGYIENQKDIESQLRDIFETMPQYLNEDGFFGNKFNGEVYEQQLSGNSWFLRGLVEYYRLTKNEKYFNQIKNITDQFLVKLTPYFDFYPLDITREDGGVGGHTNAVSYHHWHLSSDVGCAFILLDGATAVYQLYPNEKLKLLIETMIHKFMDIDFVSLKCQTHATLSCARGIFRYYKTVNDKTYLRYVLDIFDKYLTKGMTIDFSNINWFNRPDTWTEPCCIVDSMILSKWLFLETKDVKYLTLFNKIYTNSIRTFQRNNGGAGCSTCLTDQNNEMKMSLYEAFFCCTMRFGEGLAEISDFSVTKINDALFIPFPGNVKYCDSENNHIMINNDMYETGKIKLDVVNLTDIHKIYIYTPSHVEIHYDGVKLNKNLIELDDLKKGTYEFLVKPKAFDSEGYVFVGDLLYTLKNETVSGEIEFNGKKYSPLYDNSLFDEETLKGKIQYAK